jgi:ferredoxin-NADP reductase
MKSSIEWQIATLTGSKPETPRVSSFTFSLPDWIRHKPGQHYDVRLTAQDGYQAQRSYSIASEPEREGEIDLTVERIEDGEVSTYFHDVLEPGDKVEMRGPIGGYFVWEVGYLPEPLLLIAGGSGVVPLMAMLRHRAANRSKNPTHLLYSSRTFDDVIYYQELEKLVGNGSGLKVFHTLTRAHPQGWTGFTRRLDAMMVQDAIGPLGSGVQAFLCGPTRMVESAANALVELGLPAVQVRTERFGPSGPG